MEKKYKLTKETINVFNKTLYRIEALRDFNDVEKGDKGGFVEKEENLSQDGNCWVYGNAKVCDKAMVYNNAKVYDNVMVFDNAMVYGNAKVSGNAVVYGIAWVFDNARVFGYSEIFGNARVRGNARVFGYSEIFGNAKIYDDAKIYGLAWVYRNAEVCGSAEVCGDARICADAKVESNGDYIVFKNWWSSGRYFTWTKSNDMWKVGCFYGTGKELIDKAYRDSEISGREYERIVKYVETIKTMIWKSCDFLV